MHPPRLSWRVRLLQSGLRLAGILPLRLLHALGAVLGNVAWTSGARARRIVEHNLSVVLTQDSTEKRQAIGRAAMRETGKALLEVAKVWSGPPARALDLVRETCGAEHLDRALADNRGLIIAAPHLGCWEILSVWLASRTPLAILYRAPRFAALEPLLIRARGAARVEQVRAAGVGVRTLYRRLAGAGVVGILPDQKPRSGEGVLAPFFGVPASTMVLLPRLARRTGAQVLFAFAERLPRGAGFRVHVLPAPPGIDAADLDTACAALNRGVEECVRIAFAQYQWSYKRWPGAYPS